MRSGYVAITGKPNVGKSTLLNALLKRKIAIVSHKPQTTRNQIHAVYEDNELRVQFIDTPG
jgi:GTP-binding protein Era